MNQCEERKDGIRCLRPQGHRDVHRAVSRGGLIMWGVDSEPEPEKTPHMMWREETLATLMSWGERLLGWEGQFAPQEPTGASQSPVQDAPAPPEPPEPEGPHSRACGIHQHPHGARCHHTCPTCGGKGPEPTDEFAALRADNFILRGIIDRLRADNNRLRAERLGKVWAVIYDAAEHVEEHTGPHRSGIEPTCPACLLYNLRVALQ